MISIAFVFVKSNSPSFLFSFHLHLNVIAYSIIGEGDKITINNIYSSSIPGKITSISLEDASNDKIKINGIFQVIMEEVESLHMRRNDGSEFGQNYENEINVDGTTYTFNILTISTYYSIQS